MSRPNWIPVIRKSSADNTRNCASGCPNCRFLADAAGPIIDTSSRSAMHVTNEDHGHFRYWHKSPFRDARYLVATWPKPDMGRRAERLG